MPDIPGLNKTVDKTTGITSNSLNVTRVTGVAATITAVAAALTGIFPAENSDPTALRVAVIAAKAAVIVTSLLVAAIVVAADIRTRGDVEMVKTGSAENEAANTAAPQSHEATVMTATGTPFLVKIDQDSGGPYAVLAIRHGSEEGLLEYLVSRSQRRPEWIDNGRIDEIHF